MNPLATNKRSHDETLNNNEPTTHYSPDSSATSTDSNADTPPTKKAKIAKKKGYLSSVQSNASAQDRHQQCRPDQSTLLLSPHSHSTRLSESTSLSESTLMSDSKTLSEPNKMAASTMQSESKASKESKESKESIDTNTNNPVQAVKSEAPMTTATRPILWQPSQERINSSQLTAFRTAVNNTHQLDLQNYDQLYQWSIDQPESFWQAIADFSDIRFHTAATTVFEPNACFEQSRWFPNATLNFAENLLAHAEKNGSKPAIISRLESGSKQIVTFNQLVQKTAQLSHYLKEKGIQPGDRVAAIMPNTVETVIAMLATTSLGAIWTSCSPDFGSQSIIDRFGQTEPKIVIAADGYFYKGREHLIGDKVEQIQSHIDSIQETITVPILNVKNPVGTRWNDALNNSQTQPNFASVDFNHPAYILYSSGTTGKPKCITHSVGGTLLQHAKELRLHADLSEKDTHFYFTTCGWMMWNWLASTLQTGATTVLYDGNPFYPSQDALVKLIDEEGVTAFGASARYYAELEKQGVDPASHYDLSSLKTVMSTGSPLNPSSYHYIYDKFKDDLCLASISGGTDIISCFALGNPTLPVREGELQCRGLGMAVEVVNEAGKPVIGEKGELVCKHPFPSMPVGFWGDNNGEKYHNAYFSKFDNIWAHGDFAELTPSGGMVIYGRSDTTLNPSGVRIGTAEIYRQVEKVEEVLESVAVDQAWEGDTRIVLFVKLRPEATLDDALIKKIRTTIRVNTSPRHVPAAIAAVADIPRTFSGKTVEVAVKNVINQLPVNNVGAIANPESLELFRAIPGITTKASSQT